MQLRQWAVGPVLAALTAFALVGCGGGGGDPVSDDEYVRRICETVGNLQTRLVELGDAGQDATDLDSLRDLLDDLSGALDDAAGELDSVNPPDDIADSHDAVVDAYRDAADAMAEGEIEALEGFDPAALAPPEDVQQRLSGVAQDIEECDGLGLF